MNSIFYEPTVNSISNIAEEKERMKGEDCCVKESSPWAHFLAPSRRKTKTTKKK